MKRYGTFSSTTEKDKYNSLPLCTFTRVRFLLEEVYTRVRTTRGTTETVETFSRERSVRVVPRGALDFNSLTKLPKTRGFLSFRVDLIPRSCYDIYSARSRLLCHVASRSHEKLNSIGRCSATGRNWIPL